MAKIKIKNKMVCYQWVGDVGGERRLLSGNIVLVFYVLLGYNVFCFRYCDIICYYGCYYCKHTRMPPLGNMLDSIVIFFHVKKTMQFQIYSIRRYGHVPTVFCVSPEYLFGKSGGGDFWLLWKNGG